MGRIMKKAKCFLTLLLVICMCAGSFQGVFAADPAKYKITVSKVENGTITADKTDAAEGEQVSLELVPEDGYRLYAWTVTDGDEKEVPVEDDAFIMPSSDVTVSAQIYTEDIVDLMNLLDMIDAMDPAQYTEESWSALEEARRSIIEPTETGPYASMVASGLRDLIDELIPAAYRVMVNEVENGTIRANQETAAVGDIVSLSAELTEGYALYAWTVTDGDGNEVPIDDDAFTMPASDVTVSAQIYTEDIVELMNLLDKIDAMDSSLYTEAS